MDKNLFPNYFIAIRRLAKLVRRPNDTTTALVSGVRVIHKAVEESVEYEGLGIS